MKKRRKQKSTKPQFSWQELIARGLVDIIGTVISAYIIDKLI